jgi:hypothetical protein
MKRLILSILVLVLCTHKIEAQTSTTVSVSFHKEFETEDKIILEEALLLIEQIINSNEFKKAVSEASYRDNKNLSGKEILEMILQGTEVHSNEIDYEMDFILSTYPGQSGDNVGSTYGGTRIETSQSYIRRNGAKYYAAHLIHEYCHTLGFTHIHKTLGLKSRKRRKQNSVPYKVGSIAKKILGI